VPVAAAFLGTGSSSSGNGEIVDGRGYYRDGLEKLHDQVIGRMGRRDSMGTYSTPHARVAGTSDSRHYNLVDSDVNSQRRVSCYPWRRPIESRRVKHIECQRSDHLHIIFTDR
jgi:hypothetical protein